MSQKWPVVAVLRPPKQPPHPGGTGAQTRPVQTGQANLRSEDSFRSRQNGFPGVLVRSFFPAPQSHSAGRGECLGEDKRSRSGAVL